MFFQWSSFDPKQFIQSLIQCLADRNTQIYCGIVITLFYRADCLSRNIAHFCKLLLGQIFCRASGLHFQIFHSATSLLMLTFFMTRAMRIARKLRPHMKLAPLANVMTPFSKSDPSTIRRIPMTVFNSPMNAQRAM